MRRIIPAGKRFESIKVFYHWQHYNIKPTIIFLGNTAAAGEGGKLTGIPLTIVYASSVVGYALCTIRNLQKVTLDFKTKKSV